jgi:hypothetical protein
VFIFVLKVFSTYTNGSYVVGDDLTGKCVVITGASQGALIGRIDQHASGGIKNCEIICIFILFKILAVLRSKFLPNTAPAYMLFVELVSLAMRLIGKLDECV